jgi:hypothetical protein
MLVDILAAIVVATIIVLFVPYLISVWKLPSGHRPLTLEYDRLGQPIGVEENPDYLETQPDEERAEEREREA